MLILNTFKCYVCQTKAGNLIGIDRDSGGYPFKASSLNEVAFFISKDEAERYAHVFRNSSAGMSEYAGMTVKEFKFTLE